QKDGMLLVAQADNLARGTTILNQTLNSSFGQQAIDLGLQTLRDSGITPMIEMVDEATMFYPVPTPGIAMLMAMMNQAPNRPALSGPIFSLTGPYVAAAWKSFDDYYSLNSSPGAITWPTSSRGYSISSYVDELVSRVSTLRATGDPSKPLALTNISI